MTTRLGEHVALRRPFWPLGEALDGSETTLQRTPREGISVHPSPVKPLSEYAREGMQVRSHTLGVRMIRTGHLGLTIGFPLRAAVWIFLISATAHSIDAARSWSIFSRSSTMRT